MIIATIMEYVLIQNAFAKMDFLEIPVKIKIALKIAQEMENALRENAFVKMDLWEMYIFFKFLTF